MNGRIQWRKENCCHSAMGNFLQFTRDNISVLFYFRNSLFITIFSEWFDVFQRLLGVFWDSFVGYENQYNIYIYWFQLNDRFLVVRIVVEFFLTTIPVVWKRLMTTSHTYHCSKNIFPQQEYNIIRNSYYINPASVYHKHLDLDKVGYRRATINNITKCIRKYIII